jgi:fucose 4-O-acetylase-like acetyltransferase
MLRMLEQIRETAAQTPQRRERHVDLVRALSITLVVLGHWLVISITADNGLDGVNALAEVDWFRPLTWLFQVIPLFFFVGGYANAASFESHRGRGGDAWTWVLQRFDRLVRPTSAFLAVVAVGVVVARIAGATPGDVSAAAWLATVPLWFVAAYLAVSALHPAMWRADQRARWWVPTTMIGVVVVADVAGLGVGAESGRQINYAVVFLVFHQLGIMWRSGGLTASVSTGLAIGGAAAAVAIGLVTLGPYPVSMVDAPSDDLQNVSPPSLAFLSVGMAQIGLVLAARRPLAGWLRRCGPWTAVVAVNGVIMTVFLWHVAAAVLAALALHGLGLLPTAPIGSVGWFVLRIPWMATCLVILAVLVALFAPVEQAAAGTTPGRMDRGLARMGLAVAVVAVLLGMLGLAVAGSDDFGRVGVPAWSLGAFGIGALVLAGVSRSSGRAD